MTTTTFGNITEKTVTSIHGKPKTYKVLNGSYYHVETSIDVIEVLETVRLSGERIRIFYGNVESGKCWNEENDVIGTVSRSSGPVCIPILISKATSNGGSGILDSSILKIVSTKTKRTLYEHESYDAGEFELRDSAPEVAEKRYPFSVFVDGNLQANFETKEKAQRYIDFMKGLRHSK